MIYKSRQSNLPFHFHAVGCVCTSRDKILLLKRRSDKSHPNCWGIPGGKVNQNESVEKAMTRELFEETGLIRSSENLSLVGTYHIVTEDMSFLYTVFYLWLENVPQIRIRVEEHVNSGWFTLPDSLALPLVADLEECLLDAVPVIEHKPFQLVLWSKGEYINRSISSDSLEGRVVTEFAARSTLTSPHQDKLWYCSFGPPAAGKTTGLKAMVDEAKQFKYVEEKALRENRSRLYQYLQKAFIERDIASFFKFQIEVLALRFWQAMSAPNGSLVDETIYSTLAYSRALHQLEWLTDEEYQTFYLNYLSYKKLMPLPQCVFFFNCKPATILARIKGRKRVIEQHFPQEYVESLSFAFSQVASELSKELVVKEIDTDALRPEQVVCKYAP